MPEGAEPIAETHGRAAADGVTRLVNADARQALERIQSSALVGEGRVCLLGLDAVRQRLGARWAGRRDMVYEYMQQTLRKQLGPTGFVQRISESDFLVAQPGLSPLANQAYCLNSLREVLTFFLGEALINDIVVHQVTSIEAGKIGANKLDAAKVEADHRKVEESRRRNPPTPTAASALISQDRWSPFVANDGRKLHVSCQLEPVFQLKTYGRIGYRLKRTVLQLPGETPLSLPEQRKLTGADIERIDFATLARGLNRLQQEGAGERQPSLILPVSFVTLSSQRGRAMLADFFRAAQGAVQQGLICEVCDIIGVPPSALLAATSLMRPFCLFIVGRLDAPPPAPLTVLKDTGLQGVTIQCPPGLETEDHFGAFAHAVVTAARPAMRAVMLYGVAGPRQAAIAGLHGATHASFASTKAGPQN
ncbi:MAG: hypothetical protein ACREEQ_10030, partial [Caulobacteraceae bacterium]